jgi:hypothetical protein
MTTRPNPSYGLKILFLGIAAVFLTFVPRPGTAQDVRTLCLPLEIHGGTPQETPCLNVPELGSVAKRQGGALMLKLSNGKTKVVSDTKECEDPATPENEGKCVTHALVGHIGDRQFLIHIQPWECGHPLLVSRRTGQKLELENWPNLSPNGKRFVVVTPFAECVVHDTIVIYSLASDPPRLEWRFTPDKEDYEFDGWDGENRIRLRAIVESVEVGRKQTAAEVKLTAQGWQVKRPDVELSPGAAAPSSSVTPAKPAVAPGR